MGRLPAKFRIWRLDADAVRTIAHRREHVLDRPRLRVDAINHFDLAEPQSTVFRPASADRARRCLAPEVRIAADRAAAAHTKAIGSPLSAVLTWRDSLPATAAPRRPPAPASPPRAPRIDAP